METTDKTFKQELSITDEKFDIDEMSYYRLYISIGSDNLRLCAVDSIQKRCVLLSDYRFFGRHTTADLISTLNWIYDGDGYLKANFWQSVNVLMKGNPFTLVPKEFFDESSPEKYLQLVSADTRDMKVVVSEQQTVDAVNLFYADEQLIDWFHQTYRTRVIEFVHQTAPFIEGIRTLKMDSAQSLHIFIENGYVIIGVIQEEKLQFCNVFRYRMPQDLLYFVLFVIDEIRLDKNTIPTRLYGQIEEKSEIFVTLDRYITHLEIYHPLPSWLSFGYQFNEVSNQYYFDLYSMFLGPHP